MTKPDSEAQAPTFRLLAPENPTKSSTGSCFPLFLACQEVSYSDAPVLESNTDTSLVTPSLAMVVIPASVDTSAVMKTFLSGMIYSHWRHAGWH